MLSKRLSAAAVAAIALMGIAAGPANSAVVIDITQSGANVDVTVSGELNLEGATFTLQDRVLAPGSFRGVTIGMSQPARTAAKICTN